MTSLKLSDLCNIRYGKDHKKLAGGPYPVYGSGGIMRYVEKPISQGPSVLIPRKGTLGNLFYADGPFWTVDTLFWTEIDNKKIIPKYLYYLLKTEDLAGLNIGTAVPSLSTDVLNEIQLSIPEMETQKKAVALLDSIESKININNQINDYLAELLSSEFAQRFTVNTPTAPLGEVLSILTQTLNPQGCAGEIWEHYSIPAFDESHWPVFEPAENIKSKKYIIDSNCILISKLNPSMKRMWVPPCVSDKAVCSTEFIVYKPLNPKRKSFYCSAIDSDAFTDYLLAHVTGSTGSRQRSQPKATINYRMPNPSEKEIDDYCALADPMYAQIKNNEIESQKLKMLRDALLPKLMLGEIDVSKIDITQLNNHLSDC